MVEAKLHKLKVTDLKEMLSQAGLVQSGKKDELIKRLLDAGITGEQPERLVDPDEPELAAEPVAAAAPVAAAPAPAAAAVAPAPAVPVPSEQATAPSETEDQPEEELTEEEKKQKARAERFGIPWVRQKKPAAAPKVEKPTEQPKVENETPVKPAAIDATPLGISPEVLARRAAKFGLPEKKAVQAKSPVKEEKKELSAEEATRLAEEEEKKRKRAEKFGIAITNGGDEPDAKKAKV
ncbi:hypothetical protein CcaverHIS002_0305780 [Cutaneotrichosporon cavernicola]|uniref:SAP domain-containing protein n=1 Tax=Cutaneotrichosporon cavernicola TaxID=279322 RepID=A0AA48I3E1_9TREE|nr:uncharacterized protein CcaverHIS019_0305740 [Cutaneotrichosporon cavernicola]BEI82710.1 hypothetical protein CcaverHIS002_0305780 [Cutaneotrichosporon cavernicola]BEI90504.1 hypothetical protein CcaverHIS019_0305740 [Cutaneotrichosporon cavernicola]BEI98278.1 hypothetical protein CcaverHIS631_0305770 [Cutaneotrichosporon cavernicola]BEJ06053.1 hypothetical protein CcaverHIS641_0305750 [Cutaneotrichosporon cavernicola]